MSHPTGHKIHKILPERTVLVGEERAWGLFSVSLGTECLVKTGPQNTGMIMCATTLFLFQPPVPVEVFVDRKRRCLKDLSITTVIYRRLKYKHGTLQNITDKGKPKYCNNNLPQCHFFHQKSHMACG